jgi:hypothetical protein
LWQRIVTGLEPSKVYVRLLFGNVLQRLLIRHISGQAMPIDVLPDDALLVVFDFCMDQDVNQYLLRLSLTTNRAKKRMEVWQSLVHVCRRWRSLVFGSPRRLNLQLVCTVKTPARDTLDVWPALPLLIQDKAYPAEDSDDIILLLKHIDRVYQIGLSFPVSQLDTFSAAMQETFPNMVALRLASYGDDGRAKVLPDSFLGGSAPRLRFLWLQDIPFRGLPKLLLSATHLVMISIVETPHSGYIPPERMVAALSTLTSLESFSLGFQSARSRPRQASRRPLPLTRSVLPVLIELKYEGASEYLEDLVARIDAPRLFRLYMSFFNDIVFDTPQLIEFIRRTPTMLRALKEVRVTFGDDSAGVCLSSNSLPESGPEYGIGVAIVRTYSDWQVSSLGQFCTSYFPPISTLEDLYIYDAGSSQPEWQENMLWLDLLHPFNTVKNLYLSKKSAPPIVASLRELVGGRTAEVLPTLQNIFLEELELSGPIQEGVGQFITARQGTSHPIAVSRWENSEKDKAPLAY